MKTEEQQAAALVFRTRDLAVKQRTQIGNALRSHLAEYGWVAPQGAAHLAMLADLLDDGGEIGETLPEVARPMFAMMVDMLAGLDERIAALDKEITRRAREDEVARQLMTIPGVGPITATAIAAIAPPAETFAKGRDFAAWLGLVPKQASTGGKQKLARSREWGSERCGACSSSGRARSCSRRASAVRRPAHGSRACWPGSHACWSRSRSLTRWPVPSGRCWSGKRITELRSQSRRKPRRARGVGGRSRSKEGMAQQSARRGRKNQSFPPCHEHAFGDVVPVRELPYGPAAHRCITGRTDGSIRLCIRTSKYRLQPKGRPQMGSRRCMMSGCH